MTPSTSGLVLPSAADTPRAVTRGGAPQGMWWVAWRQHRWQILTALAAMAVLAAAMVTFRIVLVAKMTAAGCSLTDGSVCGQVPGAGDLWSNSFQKPSDFLHVAMTMLPVLVGVFVAAPVFPREFAHRTQVFALTQSVGRLRWWATKVVTVGVPVVLGLLVLGFLMQWVDGTYWQTAHQTPWSMINFATHGIVPAAYGLVSAALALTAGILLRQMVAAIVVALLLATLIAEPLTVFRKYLVPPTRAVAPVITEADIGTGAAAHPAFTAAPGVGSLNVRSGYLTAAGRELSWRDVECPSPDYDSNKSAQENITAAELNLARCLKDADVVSNYTDYLPASMLWPLRWVVTGLCAALAALFLALGAWRLKPAVAKR